MHSPLCPHVDGMRCDRSGAVEAGPFWTSPEGVSSGCFGPPAYRSHVRTALAAGGPTLPPDQPRTHSVFSITRVVLRPEPVFIFKVKSTFHRTDEVSLPSFCPSSKHPKGKEQHCLDVRSAVGFGLDKTKLFHKTDSMFLQATVRVLMAD